MTASQKSDFNTVLYYKWNDFMDGFSSATGTAVANSSETFRQKG
jgi:hypothetical protein